MNEQHERPPATTGLDAADTPLAQAEVLSSWLTRANALRPESLRLPVGVLEPYAVLLSGDLGGAGELLKTVLKADPTSVDTAILLGGVSKILGETADGIQFGEAEDPHGKWKLTQSVLTALTLLSKPLLSTSDIAILRGVGINCHIAAHLLRYYADLAQQIRGTDLAANCLMQAIEMAPDESEAFLELYYVLETGQQYLLAVEWMLKAQKRFPSNSEIIRALRDLYRCAVLPEDTLKWAGKAYRMDRRNFPDALTYLCHIPAICESAVEGRKFRTRMLRNLRLLERRNFHHQQDFKGGWNVPSFAAAYHDADNRRLLEKQASVFRNAYHEFTDSFASLEPRIRPVGHHRRLRIAFASEYFSASSNSRAFEGLIKHLNKDQFYVIILHNYESKRDKNRDRVDTFADEVVVLPANLDTAARLIRKLDLDVLFHTDIGSSSPLYLLALTRLAPLQITGWGIPHTSGISTIDYYISTALAEPAGAQKYYTEKLHCVSRLPCCYLSEMLPDLRNFGRSYFFLPDETFIFGCLQQLPKLHPDFDPILEELALRNPSAAFVFVEDVNSLITQRVLDRWRSRASTMLERICLLAPMNRREFMELCACLDVLIDPPYYGSGITFYESAFTGTPTISLKGRFLRSRFVSGAYRMLNLHDPPMATRAVDYIDLCCDLAQNPERLHAIKSELASKARHFLYDDTTYVREVEAFLLSTLHQ